MQKKLLTVAVAGALAAPVAALAQVTLYGSIETGIKQTSKILNASGGTDSNLTVESQAKKSNRIGFKGSHDLGGGLMANFTLEGGYASDTGVLGGTVEGEADLVTGEVTGTSASGLFARKAVVGLSKGGNSVDLGHNYTLNHSTEGVYDPLSQDYGIYTGGAAAGNLQGITKTVRVSNSVTGNFRFGTGGIGVQYAPGEVVGQSSWGTRTGVNGDFAFGPVVVAAAFASYKDAATGTDSIKETQFGAVYTMGAFKFMGGIGTNDRDSGGERTQFMGGVNYSFSPTLLGRVAYYDLKVEDAAGTETGKANSMVVAVEYSLSKTTLVYAAFGRASLENGQQGTTEGSLQDGSTSIGAGLQVVF